MIILAVSGAAVPGIAALSEDTTNDNVQLLKKFSDYINANWVWLLIAAIVLIVLGYIFHPFWVIGVLLIISIILNWLILSPVVHG